jgi:drug/metabolite transporter (DMT)-like permease
MAAVAGGLGAALVWAIGATFASRAARALGSALTLAWVMLIGLVLVAVTLPLSGHAHLTTLAIVWLVVGGAGNVGGLLLMYRALRIGQLGVVMPIISTEGGIAALIAILGGQSVGALAAVAMAATVAGVIMTALARNPTGHTDRRAAVCAALGALTFGGSLYAIGRAGSVLPTAWAVLPPRVIGVLVLTIPLALRGRLRWVPGTGVALLAAGCCEVGGFFAYAAGARHGIAAAAVLATLNGAFGAGFGAILFGERLRASQVAGIAIIFAGVAALTALTA